MIFFFVSSLLLISSSFHFPPFDTWLYCVYFAHFLSIISGVLVHIHYSYFFYYSIWHGLLAWLVHYEMENSF